ncbi:hypothetical protein SLS59_004747 [Nothophoma quercina]|uniref:Uncharacterized protein n=1 Tax=Nothophoma quercina TaxID=749835 RepID=A0ABR3RF77_9PLEO
MTVPTNNLRYKNNKENLIDQSVIQNMQGAAKIIFVILMFSYSISGYGGIRPFTTSYSRCMYGDNDMYTAHMEA